MWVDLLASPLWQKIYYFLLSGLSAFFCSIYLQRLIFKEISREHVLYSVLLGELFFTLMFSTYWWSFTSAVLSGIIGAWLWVYRSS